MRQRGNRWRRCLEPYTRRGVLSNDPLILIRWVGFSVWCMGLGFLTLSTDSACNANLFRLYFR